MGFGTWAWGECSSHIQFLVLVAWRHAPHPHRITSAMSLIEPRCLFLSCVGNQFLWGYDKSMDAELQEVFNLMVSRGINLFDSADSYGAPLAVTRYTVHSSSSSPISHPFDYQGAGTMSRLRHLLPASMCNWAMLATQCNATGDATGTGALNGRSEQLLGQFTSEAPGGARVRENICVATKFAAYPWRLTSGTQVAKQTHTVLALAWVSGIRMGSHAGLCLVHCLCLQLHRSMAVGTIALPLSCCDATQARWCARVGARFGGLAQSSLQLGSYIGRRPGGRHKASLIRPQHTRIAAGAVLLAMLHAANRMSG